MAAYGKTAVIAHYDGTVSKGKSHRKPRDEWLVLQPGAHKGYVDWQRSEAIRMMISDNIPSNGHLGAPKHGDALLAGLLRCRRCGRKLTVRYTGTKHQIPRYSCARAWLDNGEPRCIAFGGLRVDDAIERAIFQVVEPGATAVATAAEPGYADRHSFPRKFINDVQHPDFSPVMRAVLKPIVSSRQSREDIHSYFLHILCRNNLDYLNRDSSTTSAQNNRTTSQKMGCVAKLMEIADGSHVRWLSYRFMRPNQVFVRPEQCA